MVVGIVVPFTLLMEGRVVFRRRLEIIVMVSGLVRVGMLLHASFVSFDFVGNVDLLKHLEYLGNVLLLRLSDATTHCKAGSTSEPLQR